MEEKRLPIPDRSRNKNGRIRKKRTDAHDYKEREKKRPLYSSDPELDERSNSLSEQVVKAIREGLRERNNHLKGEKLD